MATKLQVLANTANAQHSTGPTSDGGKAVASRNALRHGLRTDKLLLDDEDPAEYQALLDDLAISLGPAGAVECALIERIALCLWRQRRLTAAETAELRLDRRPTMLVRRVSNLPEVFGDGADTDLLEPYDETQRRWCHEVASEIEALDDLQIEMIEAQAPLTFVQIKRDAEDEDISPEDFLACTAGGASRYLAELANWCRTQLRQAEQRPTVLALAEQLRARHLVLPLKQLEVIARYQTTLDNQLYKALRALREAQDWRTQRTRTEPNAAE